MPNTFKIFDLAPFDVLKQKLKKFVIYQYPKCFGKVRKLLEGELSVECRVTFACLKGRKKRKRNYHNFGPLFDL